MGNITIIGTGNMARTIGTLAVAGGNTVEVTGRDQSKAVDLAKALGAGATAGKWGAVPAGDIVITALLYDGVVPVVVEYGDALAGKVIVDISNPFNATFDGLAHSEETSIAQEVAKYYSRSFTKGYRSWPSVADLDRQETTHSDDRGLTRAGTTRM
jgi:8-hydroxy-5-deazaflavin:NADPH oxidoreductase